MSDELQRESLTLYQEVGDKLDLPEALEKLAGRAMTPEQVIEYALEQTKDCRIENYQDL